MEATKCFAASIAIPKDFSCYTAQPEPTASDPKYSHILQSDMEETVVNKSTISLGFLKINAPSVKSCKESQRKVNQNNHLSLVLMTPGKIPLRIF